MEPVSPAALALHRRAIVFDGHCDTILELDHCGRTLGQRSAEGHADLPRLLEGGVTAQVFALFIEDKYLPSQAVRRTLQLADRFYQELEVNQEHILPATRAADIRRAKEEGKVAAVLGVEGGAALEGDLAILRVLHRLGGRLLTLTWSRRNALGDGTMRGQVGGGLTDLGREAVREMNRLGMLVDVSHLAAAGVGDALAVSRDPIVASHSNARAVCDHGRNLSDEHVRGIAAGGGLVGVTLVPAFVDPQKASMERLMDHIEHLLRVGGEDHVGLGSDYDGFGFDNPAFQFHDMPDVSHLPRLTEAMLGRGIPERVVEKVLGANWLRVFEEVVG